MKIIAELILAALALGKSIWDYVRDPKRWRRSVLDQIEKERQDILHKVDNLTATDKADRYKAREDLLKEIRK